ncbi:hypothetical protein CU097_014872 [Rhizopus azygosporus]|uniref:Uncharacterized protein n=1 Tax=Rhizopus azygosporus TaxID=86630 RepID=A0A367KGB8_RHIAZ|nr:hypothetical protein CU097_014872 [Rhizopus azygosporus]
MRNSNTTVSSDEEALGSKARKGGLGLKGLKVVTEDHIYHTDFAKLCNLLKDEIDHLLSKNCPTGIPVFGMHIGDKWG